MSNVTVLPGVSSPTTGTPNERLIGIISNLLERAQSGSLQQLVGVGINSDGSVCTFIATSGHDVFVMQGALSAITIEHARRNKLLS